MNIGHSNVAWFSYLLWSFYVFQIAWDVVDYQVGPFVAMAPDWDRNRQGGSGVLLGVGFGVKSLFGALFICSALFNEVFVLIFF